MEIEERDGLRAILEKIPELAGRQMAFERLGGLTNKVYRVGDYCLRVAGAGTQEYINRANEASAAEQAATAGVSPQLVHVDATSGLMVTRYIDNAVTMTPELFRQRTGSAARAGKAMAKLHGSGAVFPFRFELFAMIDDYLRILSTKDVTLPEGYHDVVAESAGLRQLLDGHALAPCHCDPLCENFLDDGERMWIVDWEYSGMNDPMWDLGDLSVEGGFDEARDKEMLLAYFGGPPSAPDHARMVIYKAMCDLLWTLWGLIQLANNNPADDFRAYADGRFARCRKLMASAEFARHRAVLAAK